MSGARKAAFISSAFDPVWAAPDIEAADVTAQPAVPAKATGSIRRTIQTAVSAYADDRPLTRDIETIWKLIHQSPPLGPAEYARQSIILSEPSNAKQNSQILVVMR